MGAAAAIMIRREREVVAAFRNRRATSPAAARTLADLGIDDSRAVRRLSRHAVLRETSPHVYYLDEPTWEALRRRRRRLAAVLLGIVLLAALIMLTTACASRPSTRQPAAAGTLRVLVFNMHAGKDAAGADNLDGVATIVRQTSADVVLLQEVDRMTRRSGGTDQPAALEARTGFHAAFGNTLHYDGGEYGIAILSRWPITSDTLLRLPIDPPQTRAGGAIEPRGALRAVIASPHGPITVFNTHLDPSQDDHWRRQEADTVSALVTGARAAGARLVVAGGDFNSTPESVVQERVRRTGMRDAWFECGSGDGYTYPADAARKRIDYLFLTGDVRCRTAEVIVTPVSDHRPLLVTLELRGDG